MSDAKDWNEMKATTATVMSITFPFYPCWFVTLLFVGMCHPLLSRKEKYKKRARRKRVVYLLCLRCGGMLFSLFLLVQKFVLCFLISKLRFSYFCSDCCSGVTTYLYIFVYIYSHYNTVSCILLTITTTIHKKGKVQRTFRL